MRRLLRHILLLLIVLLPASASAQTNDMAVEIASDRIDVTVGFTGSSIELFGDIKDKNAKIAITVEGPRKDITIWKKERVLGAWMNSKFTRFENFPVYYQYALSVDESDEKQKAILLENEVGHNALFEKTKTKASRSVKDNTEFQNALINKKKSAGLYFNTPAKIKFINDNFFRVSFKIPPSAATGEYTIKSYLFKNGKVLQSQVSKLKVEQVGLNAFVRASSKDYSLIYALICIFLGVASGWLVSVLKVKP